jgi:TonB system transport protein ExbD (group 1)
VLLIIFMIAGPLATVDVAVDLPTSNAMRQPRPDKPIFLTIKSDLSLAIGDSPVTRGALQPTLDQLSNDDRSMRIFVRADRTVPYGELMNAMNDLRTVGYLKVALVGLESDTAR